MNKVAIYIPTYNNRYSEMLNYTNILIKSYDVFIVFSNNDEKLESYNNYEWDEKIQKLYWDAKTIGEKRQFTLDYLYDKGYKYVIQIEDDIRTFASEINDNTKRTTSESYAKTKISIEEMIKKMLNIAKEYNAAFVSPSFPFSLGFSKPGAIAVNKSLNFGQFNMVDTEMLKNNNIKYDTRENVHDDIDLVLQLLQNGLNCVTLKDTAFEVIGSSSLLENSTICNGNKQDLMRINLYLKYRDGISLRIGKHGELRMTCKLDKYFNTKEIPIKDDKYHQELFELCKKYDIEGIKNLINSKK
jgi:hypothetical protein